MTNQITLIAKSFLLVAFLLGLNSTSNAQSLAAVETQPTNLFIAKKSDHFVAPVMQKAMFEGGATALTNYMDTQIDYPELAREYAVEGTVIARFRVMADGSIQHLSIKQSLNSACDRAVLKAIENMPRWTPAQQGARQVAMWREVPVKFVLD
ncbi:MAG: energy transducer TonB [Saprospiraceae bacterium]